MKFKCFFLITLLIKIERSEDFFPLTVFGFQVAAYCQKIFKTLIQLFFLMLIF